MIVSMSFEAVVTFYESLPSMLIDQRYGSHSQSQMASRLWAACLMAATYVQSSAELAYFRERLLSDTAHLGAVCPAGIPDSPFPPRAFPCHY